MVLGRALWESGHSGSRPGAAVNAGKQVIFTLWALVSSSVKWSGWTRWYLRCFQLYNYEDGSTHRPHPLYSVQTVRENKLPFGAVTSCQATHKITLAFTLVLLLSFHIIVPVLANRIPLSMESYSYLFLVMNHCGSHPPGSSLWISASNPDWDTAQVDIQWPLGKLSRWGNRVRLLS